MNQSIQSWARLIARSRYTLAFMAAGLGISGTAIAQSWTSAGADLYNSHSQTAEKQISAKTVPNLNLKWSFPTAGDVTAIPAVVNGYVYFPDSAGFIYKVNATTGKMVWSKYVPDITGVANDYARTTPAVTGSTLILGSQTGKQWGANGNYATQAWVFALNTDNGNVIWKNIVDKTPQSMVTTSAVVANGMAIVGVASNEELTAAFVPPLYWQWHFRGSAVALDVGTGKILWQTYTVPDGYYGGSIWGSTPSVDLALNQVYISSGDNYTAPTALLNCLAGGGSASSCGVDPTNYADSIIALDLTDGHVKWAGKGMPIDVWNVACGLGVPGFVIDNSGAFAGVYGNCPDPINGNNASVGPDYDFGQGPMMFSDTSSYTNRSLVGAGAKSGIFWAFRAKDGLKVWSTQVSPGGVTGGMQWGSATDGTTLYVSASNAGPSRNGGGAGAGPWKLMNGQTVYYGGWAAVDAATGKVKWTTADPYGSRAEGPVTLANGVVFGCNMLGTMFALNAKTGAPLWQSPLVTPNTCTAGASIVNGMVFWGSGDGRNGANGAKKLFAFGL